MDNLSALSLSVYDTLKETCVSALISLKTSTEAYSMERREGRLPRAQTPTLHIGCSRSRSKAIIPACGLLDNTKLQGEADIENGKYINDSNQSCSRNLSS